ncbi:MAG: polysaccharide biosynthesis protein [Saprospiraceae bacterium]|nr:polysaccharide biosynthesis protein [Saprospiraceae bacterium]
MLLFNIEKFLRDNITQRSESLLKKDIDDNRIKLAQEIDGKNFLVIGGAGTIGSNYIKSILRFQPKSLVVVDQSENGLTELTRDLRSSVNLNIPESYITYPFDFGGKIFERLLKRERFDVIACFAAHKHVRSEKDHLAIEAMIRNNIFNTMKLLENVKENPPAHFFSVSTDKAANPVNVMGATKKVMEHVLMAYTKEIKISTARFANVAFSNGSLLYGFIERMLKRQPLSSPSDVKRYFVSPQESGELCMLASLLGESGDIFFPHLEENSMMKFSTIAERFLEELGYRCDYCQTEEEAKQKAATWTSDSDTYPVYFFESDTSGEKMYEEFYTESDIVNNDRFKSLGIIKNAPRLPQSKIHNIIDRFEELFEKEINKSDIVNLLADLLPDFHHIETGKSLDQKM